MSDPNPRSSDPNIRPGDMPPASPPPSDPPPRKSASPLIWILLLIALIAFGWYFYSQRGVVTPPAEPVVPPATDIGSEQEAAAEREREATAAREQRPRAARPSVPADREPSPVARLQPTYPAAALRAREEGSVLVRAMVDAQGNASDVEIAKRSGSRDLDRAAVDAVRKWKFDPAIKDGQPVASTVEVPVEFTLEDQ